jgi:hypothetical protein
MKLIHFEEDFNSFFFLKNILIYILKILSDILDIYVKKIIHHFVKSIIFNFIGII